jgi:hypothetical protein
MKIDITTTTVFALFYAIMFGGTKLRLEKVSQLLSSTPTKAVSIKDCLN